MSTSDSQLFEKRVMEREGQRLAYYSEKARQEETKKIDDSLFINLSVMQILTNISVTFADILNDILNEGIKGPQDLVRILGRGDRLIYTGLIILLISFAFYIIDITN